MIYQQAVIKLSVESCNCVNYRDDGKGASTPFLLSALCVRRSPVATNAKVNSYQKSRERNREQKFQIRIVMSLPFQGRYDIVSVASGGQIHHGANFEPRCTCSKIFDLHFVGSWNRRANFATNSLAPFDDGEISESFSLNFMKLACLHHSPASFFLFRRFLCLTFMYFCFFKEEKDGLMNMNEFCLGICVRKQRLHNVGE
uniref:Uncharacterized protein n=1 Tax=Glossina austeni TaxID=7395 RepID=A0A1A9V4M9_GLOAU